MLMPSVRDSKSRAYTDQTNRRRDKKSDRNEETNKSNETRVKASFTLHNAIQGAYDCPELVTVITSDISKRAGRAFSTCLVKDTDRCLRWCLWLHSVDLPYEFFNTQPRMHAPQHGRGGPNGRGLGQPRV